MSISRRQFIGAAAAAGALGLTSGPTSVFSASTAGGWQAPDEATRKALIESARFGRKQAARSAKGMVICTHPLAGKAGVDMLHSGGSAADALCAAALAQTVIEPHMTTLSGCFSMLYYDAASQEYSYVNGMMAAPQEHPLLATMDFSSKFKSLRGGGLCMVPGFWGGFEAAHERFGRLPLKTVTTPAIYYAREGFEIHPFLWGEMFIESATLGTHPESREIYFSDNTLLSVGDKLIQQRAADVLEQLSEDGSEYFYRGEFARKYTEAVQARSGYVTVEDMAAYRPLWSEPVRGSYRNYELIAAPAPDFGGQAFIEIMNMVELMDLQAMGPAFESPETALKQMQIVGQVYTDAVTRQRASNSLDVEFLISKAYAEQRFAQLQGGPKNPFNLKNEKPPLPGSTQVTVVDAQGNVATALHSVMSMPFSTGIYVEGIYIAETGGHLRWGHTQPDGRLPGRICPNMFAKNGKPILASGSPSVSLAECILQNSVNILDFNLDIASAVHQPRFGGPSMRDFKLLMLEVDMGPEIITHLKTNGAEIDVVNPWNWTHGSFEGIHIGENGIATACGDPRRTAQAMGA